MSSNMKKQLARVAALSDSLDELEKKLEPLLSKPLSDTVGSLDTLQQAKLQVVLPYLINDLIFIYLRTRGVDPKTHPVVAELDRVRQYFGKIKDAEESGKKRTAEVDKAAAGRFIKHAISQARQNAARGPNTSAAGPSNSQPLALVPARVTEKMREREQYQQRLAEESDSEEPALEVIDDADESADAEPLIGKGKGVARTEALGVQGVLDSVEMTSGSQKKKRQRPMDPFGYLGKDLPLSNETPKKKKSKKLAAIMNSDAATDSRISSDTDIAKRVVGSEQKRTKKTDQKFAEEDLA